MRNKKEQTWLKSLDCYKVTRSESKKNKSKKVKGKGKRRWQKNIANPWLTEGPRCKGCLVACCLNLDIRKH